MQLNRQSMVAAVAGLLCSGAATLQAQRVVANVTIEGVGVIKASSVDFGISSPSAARMAAMGGGMGAGKAVTSDFKITRDAGQFSGALFAHVATSKRIPKVTVEMANPAGMIITLIDVLITSDQYGTNGGGQIEETLTLSYSKIEIESKGETKTGYDVKANVKY